MIFNGDQAVIIFLINTSMQHIKAVEQPAH